MKPIPQPKTGSLRELAGYLAELLVAAGEAGLAVQAASAASDFEAAAHWDAAPEISGKAAALRSVGKNRLFGLATRVTEPAS